MVTSKEKVIFLDFVKRQSSPIMKATLLMAVLLTTLVIVMTEDGGVLVSCTPLQVIKVERRRRMNHAV